VLAHGAVYRQVLNLEILASNTKLGDRAVCLVLDTEILGALELCNEIHYFLGQKLLFFC
jgi:hypothetical protein